MPINEILKAKGGRVVTVTPDESVNDVLKLLAQENIGAVVVTGDGKKLDGIVSERDIARGLAKKGAGFLTQEVAKAMTKDVVTCTPGDSIERIMGAMTEGRFRHLPVVEENQLIGMISIGDVVKRRLEQLEAEKSQLEEYIHQGH